MITRPQPGIKISNWVSIPLMLVCAAISISWGFSFARAPFSTTDFRAVYYGTECLIHGDDPYEVANVERVVRDENGERPGSKAKDHQAVTLYVNLPSTFIFVLPFALLPFSVAQMLWLLVLASLLLLASYLMWDIGKVYAPALSLFLACIVLANSIVIFSGGNTAGVAVPLCIIGAWSFLRSRFLPVGILFMALSLAIKPHDSGFVWLCFLLIGGVHRKRALQALAGTTAIFTAGVIWLTRVESHWFHNWRTNLSLISTPGYINDPTPASIVGFHTFGPIIDLQAAISVFRDDPLFYNAISYLICGTLLLIWVVATLKRGRSTEKTLLALAAVAPLTLLLTYHRPWDAKLLMLLIPACAFLWSEGGTRRWWSFLAGTAMLVMSGDIPMAVYLVHTELVNEKATGLRDQIWMVLRGRPITVILLIGGVYFTWVYVRGVFFSETSRLGQNPYSKSSDFDKPLTV